MKRQSSGRRAMRHKRKINRTPVRVPEISTKLIIDNKPGLNRYEFRIHPSLRGGSEGCIVSRNAEDYSKLTDAINKALRSGNGLPLQVHPFNGAANVGPWVPQLTGGCIKC